LARARPFVPAHFNLTDGIQIALANVSQTENRVNWEEENENPNAGDQRCLGSND
jgi:hypothetical protein